jgi:iron complex transport system substrate-binding protein
MKHPIVAIFVLLLIGLSTGCGQKKAGTSSAVQAGSPREITDMAGRKVVVPSTIKTVFCSDETATFFMYALAPELLVAKNTVSITGKSAYTSERFNQLPLAGRIFCGRLEELNKEMLVRLKPDVLLCPLFSFTSKAYIEGYEKAGKLAGIPVVMVALDFERLAEAFRFAGDLFGKPEKADTLSAYCQQTLAWADSIRGLIKKPVSLYVAEGKVGLNTIPLASTHNETTRLAGIRNCAEVEEAFGFKELSLDFEQLLLWNPDWILVNSRTGNTPEKGLYQYITTNAAWQQLKAVQQGHLLITPNEPFNWIGRPPGINRLIGLRWLVASVYPELTSADLKHEIRRFYYLFYHVSLSDDQIEKLIEQ